MIHFKPFTPSEPWFQPTLPPLSSVIVDNHPTCPSLTSANETANTMQDLQENQGEKHFDSEQSAAGCFLRPADKKRDNSSLEATQLAPITGFQSELKIKEAEFQTEYTQYWQQKIEKSVFVVLGDLEKMMEKYPLPWIREFLSKRSIELCEIRISQGNLRIDEQAILYAWEGTNACRLGRFQEGYALIDKGFSLTPSWETGTLSQLYLSKGMVLLAEKRWYYALRHFIEGLSCITSNKVKESLKLGIQTAVRKGMESKGQQEKNFLIYACQGLLRCGEVDAAYAVFLRVRKENPQQQLEPHIREVLQECLESLYKAYREKKDEESVSKAIYLNMIKDLAFRQFTAYRA